MKQLYIVGAGSVGGHIASNPLLYGLEDVEILFIDRDPDKIGETFLGRPIVGSVDYLLSLPGTLNVVIGAAFPNIKKRVFTKLSTHKNISFPTLIATNAWISQGVTVGCGVIVYPNCSVNYGTTLEDFSILNMNCAVGHGCSIGQYTSLAPGVNLGGNTRIGSGTEIGIGAATIQSIIIGDDVQIGGQAMVVENIPSGAKVRGVPAKLF